MWNPAEEWKGQDAFIIGGGSSLKEFVWDKLKGKNTIGANDAFRLGADVTHVCIFGDASFFHRHKWELEKFGGKVVSCAPSLLHLNLPWVLKMDRIRDGLGSGSILGWNYSTGAAAVCLAYRLGASRIFLLGFDMGVGPEGKDHWHSLRGTPTQEVAYQRFQKGFRTLAAAIAGVSPRPEVFNVTDGGSRLTVFPTKTFAELEEVLIEQYIPVGHHIVEDADGERFVK